LQWIREKWWSFDTQTIKESFRYCGIQKHRSNIQVDIMDENFPKLFEVTAEVEEHYEGTVFKMFL
jgi:hypothetical protein